MILMIKEVGNDKVILNPDLLKPGDEALCFAKIKSIDVKIDVNNHSYLQVMFSGINGTLMPGRLFGDTVQNYLDTLNEYQGKIVAVHATVDVFGGTKYLRLVFFEIAKDLPEINTDLFNCSIPNVNSFVSFIREKCSSLEGIYKQLANGVLKSKQFTTLLYKSDVEVFNGADGYNYVLIAEILKQLELYSSTGLLNNNEMQCSIASLLVGESYINAIEKNEFDYAFNVCASINSLLKNLEGKNTFLKEVTSSYVSLRLGIDSKSEMKCSRLLYNLYCGVVNNLKFINQIGDGVVSIDGKFIK